MVNVRWWFLMLSALTLPVLCLVVSHLAVIIVELDAMILCQAVGRSVLKTLGLIAIGIALAIVSPGSVFELSAIALVQLLNDLCIA